MIPLRHPDFLRGLLIAAAGFWIYAPALQGGWLMDDNMYLTQNVLLHDPARLWKIWFAPGSLIEYYPIEATLQAVQWHLWHDDTLGYHLTNVALHIVSGLLVWRLLARLGLKLAWLGGFLFVAHPVAVESVAWISELKNALSLPPLLLAMCAWIDFEEKGRARDYVLALGFFLVAMLCKISAAPLPVVLLLFAWWRRGRVGWRDLRITAPFFAIALGLGLTTAIVGSIYQTSRLQGIPIPDIGGPLDHLALAGTTLAFYFSTCLWPFDLMPVYPKWPVDPPSPAEFLPWLVLAPLAGWLSSRRATWGRHALLGLGFFVVFLAPFLGFIGISYMIFAWVMDHFLYIPIIGLIGLAVAGIEAWHERLSTRLRPVLLVASATGVAVLAWSSHQYAAVFASPEAFWTCAVERNPAAWIAHCNLGNVFFETGRVPEAKEQYERALRFNPRMAEAHNNLGRVLEQEGDASAAIEHYRQAVKINQHFFIAQVNLARALENQGFFPEAMEHYRQAALLEPGDSGVREELARLRELPSAVPSQK